MPSTATDVIGGVSTSVAVKAPCAGVEASQLTLSGLQGYEDGDRVLVIGQDDATENGIYNASTGQWQRAADADGNRDLVQGTRVLVRNLGVSGVEYELITENPVVIDESELYFELRYGANATYDQTAAEIAQGVVPVDRSYLPGDIRRYGTNVVPGLTDMSTPIANALKVSATHRTIFQPETYLSGMWTFRSGYNVYLPPGCRILDKGVLGVNDRFFTISSEVAGEAIENVHIEAWGAKVQLIKANYGSGEQRHAVAILGDVYNVTIEGLEAIDTGGDGFCIGGVGGGIADTPERIRLVGCRSDNARRNGLSITQGKNIKVLLCEFLNTDGTSPEFGVDVEPDAVAGAMVGVLDDILIQGCYSENNSGTGFSFIGGPYTAVGKTVNIVFDACVDKGSNVNFQMQSSRSDITGSVTFLNCKGYNAQTNGFDCPRSGMRCLVDGMWIYNANQSGGATARFGSSYSIYSVNQTDGTTYGNVRIRNSYAFGTTALKALNLQLVGEPNSLFANLDIEIHTDAVATKRFGSTLSAGQVSGKHRVVFTDETEIATTTSLGTSTMPAYLNDIVTNSGAAGAIGLSLDDPISRIKGTRVRARVKTAQRMELLAGSNWTIGGGAMLLSSKVNSEVTLEAQPIAADGSTGKWVIVSGGEGWSRDPIAFDNSGTPSVANGNIFETGGTTTITSLLDGDEGQEITILVKHAVTFNGATLKGPSGGSITGASGDLIRGVFDGTNWRLSFHDCTP